MKAKKKICIIAPSLQMGGIERQLSILSSHFSQKGYQVTYVACRKGERFYALDPEVKFVEPPFFHTNSKWKKLYSYLKTVRFLRREIKKSDPDTIMSFGDIINPISLLANKGLGYPIYIADQISPRQNLGLYKNLTKKITYGWATGIIAQTTEAAIYKYEVFGDNINIKVIPNSLREINEYHEKKQNWIIGIGRLSYEKGFDRLLDAFAKIKRKEGWSLVIAGDGPEKKRLLTQAHKLGIADKVKFLGTVKDIDRILAQSKIFVIPSRYEGFPNALCEAMASPLPCISFDSVPTENLITDGVDGIVVKDDDINMLAQKIDELIKNTELRTSLANKAKSIRIRLEKNKIAHEFLNFIFDF